MKIEIHHGLWKCTVCDNRFWIRSMNDEQLMLFKNNRIQCGQCFSNMTNYWLETVAEQQ